MFNFLWNTTYIFCKRSTTCLQFVECVTLSGLLPFPDYFDIWSHVCALFSPKLGTLDYCSHTSTLTFLESKWKIRTRPPFTAGRPGRVTQSSGLRNRVLWLAHSRQPWYLVNIPLEHSYPFKLNTWGAEELKVPGWGVLLAWHATTYMISQPVIFASRWNCLTMHWTENAYTLMPQPR